MHGWRVEAWRRAQAQEWDVIIIGGGITGAGILSLATRRGLRTLLLEQGDFASGTSSRSSKLVHGGLRYLKQMKIRLTRESVKERQQLLHDAPGLVEQLGFIYPVYRGDMPPAFVVEIGLNVYTHLARGTGGYRRLNRAALSTLVPGIKTEGLIRGFHYHDAWTDDARLVIRVIHDALVTSPDHAVAINYAQMTGIIRSATSLTGVAVRDKTTDSCYQLKTRAIINATGAWADEVRGKLGLKPRLRPLRGSHLYFRADRFPLLQAISFIHPDDGRFIFAYPWEGVTLLGTTDVDHDSAMSIEPRITEQEFEYLLSGAQHRFPALNLNRGDVVSTQAGVRPVIDTGKKDPSAESRDHAIWREKGLITATGGKLTTFQKIAADALHAAQPLLSGSSSIPAGKTVLNDHVTLADDFAIDSLMKRRLVGRYGSAAIEIVRNYADFRTALSATPYLEMELAWSADNEAVHHLDDLLLRRFRFGIIQSDGGLSMMHRIRELIQRRLGWDDKRWNNELDRYTDLLTRAHAP